MKKNNYNKIYYLFFMDGNCGLWSEINSEELTVKKQFSSDYFIEDDMNNLSLSPSVLKNAYKCLTCIAGCQCFYKIYYNTNSYNSLRLINSINEEDSEIDVKNSNFTNESLLPFLDEIQPTFLNKKSRIFSVDRPSIFNKI
jgi:hypothetical protein